ncbi:MAG: hypothetical protein RBT80_10925 [Candidatus Vecturithrix sp.]|jgi:hypothetical protein|nr:hypothetical protein [Candidatus Vecturithrix sp.]
MMDQKELLRTIARASEKGWTSLDVSNQSLTELPSEIGKGLILSRRDI